MEWKDLQGFVLIVILIAMILGVGLIVLDKFGDTIKESTPAVNETLVVASATGTTANDEVTAITLIYNETMEIVVIVTVSTTGADNFSWVEDTGVISFNDSVSVPDGDYLITYTYDADTTSSTSMKSVVSSMIPIATTWLPLIITIAILAIILGLVIRSFAGKRR